MAMNRGAGLVARLRDVVSRRVGVMGRSRRGDLLRGTLGPAQQERDAIHGRDHQNRHRHDGPPATSVMNLICHFFRTRCHLVCVLGSRFAGQARPVSRSERLTNCQLETSKLSTAGRSVHAPGPASWPCGSAT